MMICEFGPVSDDFAASGCKGIGALSDKQIKFIHNTTVRQNRRMEVRR